MRDSTEQVPSKANAKAASPTGLIAVGLALVVAMLIVPLVAYGQSGPLRDQGQAEHARPADPTPTARMFQARPGAAPAVDAAPPSGQASHAHTLRPGQATNSEPSRRPRPDPAPVVLLPTAVPAPPIEAAPATVRRAVPDRDRSAPPAPSRFWPVAAGTFEISQPFGCVPQLLGYYPVVPGCPSAAPAYHTGLDFAAEQGTPIYAAASGWVTIAGRSQGDGVNTQIVIQHDGGNEGYATEYYHWIRSFVRPGDYVEAGDPIAEVGSVGYSTGPHLHFTVVDTATGQQVDPAAWLPVSASTRAATNPANPTSARAGERDSTRIRERGSAWEQADNGGIVVVDYIEIDPTPTSDAPLP